MIDRIISENECETFSTLSKSQRSRLMRIGKFPKKYKICDRRSGWFESELNEWADGIKRQKAENDAIALEGHTHPRRRSISASSPRSSKASRKRWKWRSLNPRSSPASTQLKRHARCEAIASKTRAIRTSGNMRSSDPKTG